MDAAKPSSEGASTQTGADKDAPATKPIDRVLAPSAKRPEQMFVVQKPGPAAPNPSPPSPGPGASVGQGATPGAMQTNAFQAAISQGAGMRMGAAQTNPAQPGHAQPANTQSASPEPANPQPAAPRPAAPQQTGVQAARPQGGAGVPAMATEAGLPEPAEVEIRPDPLLSCLVILTRLFGNPKSLAALAAGLPIGEAGMTPDLFVRAAENAGLSAAKVRRGLEETKSINLPAVLLLRERQAVVMLSPIKNAKVDIATTDNLDGIVTISIAELEKQYSGTMLV
ncbi:MAG: cysteine peptidase family C39 domain-containing protein, partial [Dongiaceae bacterium]